MSQINFKRQKLASSATISQYNYSLLKNNSLGNKHTNKNKLRAAFNEVVLKSARIDESFIINLINGCDKTCSSPSKKSSSSYTNCIKLAFTTSKGVDWNKCIAEVTRCREISINKTDVEKRTFATKIFKDSLRNSNSSEKYLNSSWRIKNVNDETVDACKNCFMKLYGITKYQMDSASKAYKADSTVDDFHVDPPFKDDTLYNYTHSEATTILEENLNSDFDPLMVADGLCPWSESNVFTSLWIEEYFATFADSKPNHVTVHASLTYSNDLYRQYEKELGNNVKLVDESTFNHLWNTLFPYYCIRPWLNVPGKCETCYNIDSLRRGSTDTRVLNACKQAHFLHKAGLFARERRCYKKKVLEAKTDGDVLSIIIDGMDQFHSRVPYNGSQNTFEDSLTQHIQGVLVHGVPNKDGKINNYVRLYRTYDNITKGADLTIFTIFAEIEEYRRRNNGRSPRIIYVQLDGGSENSNVVVLGALEYLIAMGVVEEIWYTRLPTGHTHEDIDSVFGQIWLKMRQQPVQTIEKYAELVTTHFKSENRPLFCTEIYALPDYVSFFKNICDQELGRYAKGEQTQHCWCFRKVRRSILFPTGVCVTYRAYASDMVVVIKKQLKSQCLSKIGQITGLEPLRLPVRWYPAVDTIPGRNCEGFHILKTAPTLAYDFKFSPKAFAKGSFDQFQKTYSAVYKTYANDNEVKKSWDAWMTDLCPDSDDVNQYLNNPNKRYSYRQPLLTLFQETRIDGSNLRELIMHESSIDFEWPEGIVVPMPCVTSKYDKNLAVPARLYIGNNVVSQDSFNFFKDRCKVYYADLKKKTKDKVFYGLFTRLINELGVNEIGNVNESIAILVNKIRIFNQKLIMTKLRPLDYSYIHFLEKELDCCNLTSENSTQIKSKISFIDETTKLTVNSSINLGQLIQFRKQSKIKLDVMKHVLLMFQNRDLNRVSSHAVVNKDIGNRIYTPYLPSLFVPPENGIFILPNINLYNNNGSFIYHRIYLTFKPSGNEEIDDWCCIVINFNDKSIDFISHMPLTNMTELPADTINENLETFKNYENQIKSWINNSRCALNGPINSDETMNYVTCKYYPYCYFESPPINNFWDSAIYIFICFDLIYNECPISFKYNDVDHYRNIYCMSCLQNALDY